jgi:hypothetical protein
VKPDSCQTNTKPTPDSRLNKRIDGTRHIWVVDVRRMEVYRRVKQVSKTQTHENEEGVY